MRLRGRKGIREEIENQPQLVILNPTDYRNQWHQVFGNSNPIHIELGMGKGRFISEMSMKYPHHNYIGIDMYDELVRKASEKARVLHQTDSKNAYISNLKLVLLNIEKLEEVFGESEIDRVYLNFSDPWPKKRHASRRLTHPQFLKKYTRVMRVNGEIHMKTDSMSLFEFSLNAMLEFGMNVRNISLHLHEDGIRENHVLTEYEQKFIAQGLPIYRCEAILSEHLKNTQEDCE